MQDDLKTISVELDALVHATQEDYDNEFWDNYIKYVEQYNDILAKFQKLGLFTDEKPIQPVPEEQRAYMHYGFSSAEQAKLREVANASRLLSRKLKLQSPPVEKIQESSEPLDRIGRLCSRFHIVACQLEIRHDNRETLKIKDEYDVQDLIHALLRVDFDDIRREVWIPSYAGGSSKIDFVLHNEKIVIETKMIREGLDAKKLGEELLIDIAKYKNFQDCKTLVCFVYDREGKIQNPRGIEGDLEKVTKEVKVKAFIRPTGE